MKYKVKLRITDLSGENRKLAFNLEEGLEFVLGKKAVSLKGDVCMLVVRGGRLVAHKPKSVKSPLMLNNQAGEEFYLHPGDILQSNGYAVEFIEVPHASAAETQFVDIASLKMEATRVGNLKDPELEEKKKASEPVSGSLSLSENSQEMSQEVSQRTPIPSGEGQGDVSLDVEAPDETPKKSKSKSKKDRTKTLGVDAHPHAMPSEEAMNAARERELEFEREREMKAMRQREREEARERSQRLMEREKLEREADKQARALAKRTEETQSQTRFTRYFSKSDLSEGSNDVTRFAKLQQDRTELAVSIGMIFFFSGLAAVAGRFAGFFPGALIGVVVAGVIASMTHFGRVFFRLRHTLPDYLHVLAYVSLGAPVAAWAHTREPILGAWAFGALIATAFGALFHRFKPEPKRFIPVGVSVSAAVIASLLSIPHPVELEVASVAHQGLAAADRQPAEATSPATVTPAAGGAAQTGGAAIQAAKEPKDLKAAQGSWVKPEVEERVSVLDPLASEQYFTAIREGNLAVVKDLVSRRAVDPSFTLERGNTGLMIAAATGKLAIVKFLASQRVSLNAQDPNGTTALMWAVYRGHDDIAEFLINKGSNLDLRRDDGDRAEDLAKRWNRTEIVRLFEAHNAALRAKQKEQAAKAAKLKKRLPAGRKSDSSLGRIRSLR
jgi:hypothetical protein